MSESGFSAASEAQTKESEALVAASIETDPEKKARLLSIANFWRLAGLAAFAIALNQTLG